MKCVKKVSTGKIKRVSDAIAMGLVKVDDLKTYEYCPKWEWKEQEGKPYKGRKEINQK